MRSSLMLGLLCGALAACGGSDRTPGRTPNGNGNSNNNNQSTKTPQALGIEFGAQTLTSGARAGVIARMTYDDGTTADVSGAATWVSSNPEVAEVVIDAGAAFVEGKIAGTAQLTAVSGDLVARTDIIVTPVGETLVSLALSSGQVSVRPGAQSTLTVTGVYDSGAQRDVTGVATWQSSDVNVATVQGGVVTGVAVGRASITVSLGDITQSAAVTVADGPSVSGITLDQSALSLSLGGSQGVIARARYTDGNTVDVTQQATWTSSNPAVATAAAGRVTATGEGSATVTVAFDGAQASLTVSVSACSYPSGTMAIQGGAVLPNMSWTGAYDENGNTVDFSTQQFHCGGEYSSYSSLVIVVGAEWCPQCPDYKRRVNGLQSQLAAAGAMTVYVEIQDRNTQPASHEVARRSVDAVISNGAGLRVGDGETAPTPMVFAAATQSVPTAYVVRKSDMQVIGDQGQSQYVLDFVALAYQAAGTTPPTNCGPGDEESFEPNDAPAQAGTLVGGQAVTGGVCDQNPDFYTVDHAGSWTLDLTFSHATGDLDMYVWDTANNQPLEVNGQVVGSESSTDNESITHSGPATIFVYGYNGATAPYQLLLTTN